MLPVTGDRAELIKCYRELSDRRMRSIINRVFKTTRGECGLGQLSRDTWQWTGMIGWGRLGSGQKGCFLERGRIKLQFDLCWSMRLNLNVVTVVFKTHICHVTLSILHNITQNMAVDHDRNSFFQRIKPLNSPLIVNCCHLSLANMCKTRSEDLHN